MTSALSESGQRALYQEAASTLARGTGADRVAIFHLGENGELAVGGVHGMTEFSMAVCPLSVTVIKGVIASNRNVMYSNAPADVDARDNVSLQLSGAISLLCIPFYDLAGKPVGALYADTTRRMRAFHRRELLFARDCASWLEGCLSGQGRAPRPEAERPRARTLSTVIDAGTSVASATSQPGAADRSRRASQVETSNLKVSSGGLMVFFRSLATLTQAGVNIDVSLHLLGGSGEDPAMAQASRGLFEAVSRGEPISAAMERFPRVFSPQVRSVLRVGERTGRLVHVLEVLAKDLEKSQHLAYKLRSALTYPAVLAVACAAMMVFGPPYLLQGHLRALEESGVPLPWTTRGLLMLSHLSSNPLALAIFLTGAAAAAVYLRSDAGQQSLVRQARRAPLIGPILSLLSLTEFARQLALMSRSGMTTMEALAQTRQGCRDEALRDAIRKAEQAVRGGDSLTDAMKASGFFSATFVSFVETGEESGSLPRLIAWMADFYERDLEASLNSFVALAEPVIMGVMGAVTAVILVATIKPTLLLLQNL